MSRMRIAGLVVFTVAAVWLLALVAAHRSGAATATICNRLELLGTDLLFVALLAAAGRLWLRGRARSATDDTADELPMSALRRGKYAFETDPVSRRAGRQVRPGGPLAYKAVRRNG